MPCFYTEESKANYVCFHHHYREQNSYDFNNDGITKKKSKNKTHSLLLSICCIYRYVLHLVCCYSWGRKESDTTERLIWSDLILSINSNQRPYFGELPLHLFPITDQLSFDISKKGTVKWWINATCSGDLHIFFLFIHLTVTLCAYALDTFLGIRTYSLIPRCL